MTKKNNTQWVPLINRVIADCSNPNFEAAANEKTLGLCNQWLQTLLDGHELTSGRSDNLRETIKRRLKVEVAHNGPIKLSKNQLRTARRAMPDIAKVNTRAKLGDYVTRAEHEHALQTITAMADLLDALRIEVAHLQALQGITGASPQEELPNTPACPGEYVPNDPARLHRAKSHSKHDLALWRSKGKVFGNIKLNGTEFKLQFQSFDKAANTILVNSVDHTWIETVNEHMGAYFANQGQLAASVLYAAADDQRMKGPTTLQTLVLLEWQDDQIIGARLVHEGETMEFKPSSKLPNGVFYKGQIK